MKQTSDVEKTGSNNGQLIQLTPIAKERVKSIIDSEDLEVEGLRVSITGRTNKTFEYSLGLEVELIPFPLFSLDFLPVLTKAAEFDPDAIVVAAADLSCAPIMQTKVELGIEAQLYLVGACAAEEIQEVAGSAVESVLFNSEGPLEESLESSIYDEVVKQYASDPAGGDDQKHAGSDECDAEHIHFELCDAVAPVAVAVGWRLLT